MDNLKSQLEDFNKQIKRCIKKYIKIAYYDTTAGDLVHQNILDKLNDNPFEYLQFHNLPALYEWTEGTFKTPQEVFMMWDMDLMPNSKYASDAFIRLMVKGKRMWIENWAGTDLDEYENDECYEYNMSSVSEETRNSYYGKNKELEFYNHTTNKYWNHYETENKNV